MFFWEFVACSFVTIVSGMDKCYVFCVYGLVFAYFPIQSYVLSTIICK